MDINIFSFIFVSILSACAAFAFLFGILYVLSFFSKKREKTDDEFFARELEKARKNSANKPTPAPPGTMKERDIKDIKFVKTKNKIDNDIMQAMQDTFSSHGYSFIEDRVVPDAGLLAKMGVHEDGSAICIWGHPFIGSWFEAFKKKEGKVYMWTNNPFFSPKSIRQDQVVKHLPSLTIHDVNMYSQDVISSNPKDKIDKESIIDFMKSEHRQNQRKYFNITPEENQGIGKETTL